VGENRDRLLSFIEHQGIELVFTERIAPALGMSYRGRIAILPSLSKAEEFLTLVHEVAGDVAQGRAPDGDDQSRSRDGGEAIAFVVGKAVGLENANASADYVAFAVM
jgi:hypothetical protein